MSEHGATLETGDAPPSRLSFSVQAALSGPQFLPRNPEPDSMLQEILTTRGITVACQECPDETKFFKVSSCTTSNIIRHLSRHHSLAQAVSFKEWLAQIREVSSRQNPPQAGRAQAHPTGVSQQALFENTVVNFIVESMVPIQTVDQVAFRGMFTLFNLERQGLKLPTQRTIGRRINATFDHKMNELRAALRRPKWVATTADVWSSGNRNFLGMTVHWLDDNYNRMSAALACRPFPSSHSYDRIADLVRDVHQEFELPWQKIVATMTHNASNFMQAFVELGVQVENLSFDEDRQPSRATSQEAVAGDESDSGSDEEGQEAEGEVCEEAPEPWLELGVDVIRLPHHVRCAAHTLTSCVATDAVKVLEANPYLKSIHREALAKCNALWNLTRRPRTAEVIKLITGRRLPRPVATRWNSLYDCVKALIEVRQHYNALTAQLAIGAFLTEDDISYLEEYVRSAAPIATAVEKLEGEATTFYGTLLPTLLMVKRYLLGLTAENLRFCKPLVDGYLQSVHHRFSEVLNCKTDSGERAALASLSLPRFKASWFPCIPQIEQEHLLTRFRELISEHLAPVTPHVAVPLVDAYYNFGESPQGASLSPASLRFHSTTGQALMNEYLNDSRENTDMLRDYPAIEQVFRKYNTPPPSSPQVHSLFSYATMMSAPKSSRLSDEKFQQRVLLRVNAHLKFP